jgi:SOS-response transcriptional repressor LexA
MITKELTERQVKVLRFIERSVSSTGYPPTIREIGNAFGIKSTNGVNDHLRALMRKGYLAKEAGKSRTLTLLQPKAKRNRTKKSQSTIPIFSSVEETSTLTQQPPIFAVFSAQEQTMTVFKRGLDNVTTILSSFRFAF